MRRSTFFSFLFLLLGSANLPAQMLQLGPYAPLPQMSMEHGSPSIVALDDGNFVLASRIATSHRASETTFATVDSLGETLLNTWSTPYTSFSRHHGLVATPDHRLFTTTIIGLFPAHGTGLGFRMIDPLAGGYASAFSHLAPPETPPSLFDVVRLTDDRFATAWNATAPFDIQQLGLFAQVFSQDGNLAAPPIQITPAAANQIQMIATPSGGFMVAWRVVEGHAILARVFDANGQGGPIQEILSADERVFSFDLVTRQGGESLVTWTQDTNELSPIFARRLHSNGQPFLETLSISEAGSGPRAATDAFGRTWLTWGNGQDVFVRILGSNGSMSELLDVPPGVEGRRQTFPQIAVNQQGHAMVTWRESTAGPEPSTLQATTITIDNSCMESDTMLCLHQGRFQVEIDWTDHAGDIGQGRVVPFQSSDSGLFWFFNEANWEVMVKVIDGCAFNGFYWIFSAATTDVAYDLKVFDTVSGLEQIYSNGLGEPAPANTDTMALMSCDHGPP